MKRYISGKAAKTFVFLLVILQVILMSASAKEDILSLYKNKPEDNIAFNVMDMLPGDYVTKNYNVRVSYKGSIKIYFTADVEKGSEKLAEVLMCQVVLPDKNKILYKGLLSEMGDLEHTLSSVKKTEDIRYEISVYLDTGVGNNYQNKQLKADFKWWAYTSNEGYGGGKPNKPSKPVDTGEDRPDIPPPDDGHGNTPGEEDDKPDFPPGEEEPVNPEPPQGEGTGTENEERPTGELIDPPATGDTANPVLWIALILISLLISLLIVFFKRKRKKAEKNPIIKKLTACIVIIIILAICLCITTFALVYSAVTRDKNIFKTGTVEINLNDGRPIINHDGFVFEPGMTVKKDFFIENESSDAVYCKIYFDNIRGDLKTVLDVKIIDVDKNAELYNGKVENLNRQNSESSELLLNEKKNLTAVFHYPEESSNKTKNMSLYFDMCAVATQKRNNPERKFD